MASLYPGELTPMAMSHHVWIAQELDRRPRRRCAASCSIRDRKKPARTAALLVRVATADGDMSEAKRAKLHAVLKSGLGLDDPTTARLIVDATAADRGAVDLYHFTRQLNDVLDDEGRRRVIRTMWEVILVDGTANEFASNLVWRTADLLGVSSRQRIALRQLIAAAIPAEVAVPKTW